MQSELNRAVGALANVFALKLQVFQLDVGQKTLFADSVGRLQLALLDEWRCFLYHFYFLFVKHRGIV